MLYRYRHESDIYSSLSRIPLHVRMKLDLTGVKISLKAWLAFDLAERTALCHLPVETDEEKQAFSSYLDFLSRKYFTQAAAKVPPESDTRWNDLNLVPSSVHEKSARTGRAVSPEEWRALDFYRRYALYKLSNSKNEPEQFFAALEEFRE